MEDNTDKKTTRIYVRSSETTGECHITRWECESKSITERSETNQKDEVDNNE